MAEHTSIEWTDATWNPIRGTKGRWACTKISEGCQNCYAERLNLRFGGPQYRHGADMLRLDAEALTQPLRWRRSRRVFVCSMTDMFEERVPDEWIARVFASMALARQHTFQVLTKRAERMAALLAKPTFLDLIVDSAEAESHNDAITLLAFKMAKADGTLAWPFPHVWLGVSVENQARADERIPWLLQTPAAVRFLSVEPLLGPVDLSPFLRQPVTCICTRKKNLYGRDNPYCRWPHGKDFIDWVIVGGESGGPPERALVEKQPCRCLKSSRPYHLKDCGALLPKPEALEWVRNLRDECLATGVAFFHKQWGGPTPKSGGRLLDGKEWSEYPSQRQIEGKAP